MRITRAIAGGWAKLRGTSRDMELNKWSDKLVEALNYFANRTTTVINGNLGFGDGVDYDNIRGKWITFTSNAVGGVETAITHNLQVIPVGMLLMVPPKNGTLTAGASAWTVTQLFLTCSVANQVVTIFVLPPSS